MGRYLPHEYIAKDAIWHEYCYWIDKRDEYERQTKATLHGFVMFISMLCGTVLLAWVNWTESFYVPYTWTVIGLEILVAFMLFCFNIYFKGEYEKASNKYNKLKKDHDNYHKNIDECYGNGVRRWINEQ